MKKFLISFFTFLLLSNNLFAAEKDVVVATINGKEIFKSKLDEEFQKNRLYVSNVKVTKEKVLYDIINRDLGIKRALKAKLQNNQTVKEKMDNILFHAQISKDLEPRFKKIVITDSDVRSYYKNWPEYRTAHILFREQVNASKKDQNTALNQAKKVYNALKKSPNKFPEFANKFSQSAAAATGGDMGYQPAIRLAPEYFQAIKNKSLESITRPTRTQFGVHIIKVLGVKKYKNINQAIYKKIVYDQKRDKIIAQYFRELRQTAKIVIHKKHLKSSK